MTAAATTGPASGPRPASSQPATGQTPRFIAARSRRKVGRMSSSPSGRRIGRTAGGATHAAMVRGAADKSMRDTSAVWKPGRNCQSGSGSRPSADSGNPGVVRNFPEVPVGIGEIAGVAAPEHLLGACAAVAPPDGAARASAASTSAGDAQFHASDTPRKFRSASAIATSASFANSAADQSDRITPPASKNATPSAPARLAAESQRLIERRCCGRDRRRRASPASVRAAGSLPCQNRLSCAASLPAAARNARS